MFFLLLIFLICAAIWKISFKIVLPVILVVVGLEFLFWIIKLIFGLILLPFNSHLLVPLLIIALVVWIWKTVRTNRKY
ncbi:MAG: hypothetical protein LBV19_07600 [Streptococcaceae bacterium]|jgi:hypothetical protein|nr:hypothetical protein [Streptococcaceae bacterium]